MARELAVRSYRYEGTSALAPEALRTLRVLDGGLSGRHGTAGLEAAAAPVVTSRQKVLAGVVLAVILVAFALSAYGADALAASWRAEAVSGIATTSVRVSSGDSLWSIAAERPVDGLTTQEVVDWISKENGLSSSTLLSGQDLVVPEIS